MFIVKRYEKLFLVVAIALLIQSFALWQIVVAETSEPDIHRVSIASEEKNNELASLLNVYKEIVDEARGKLLLNKGQQQKAQIKKRELTSVLWSSIMQKAIDKGDAEPVYLIRGLQKIQDMAVKGDKDAQAVLSKAFLDVGTRLLALNQKVWHKKQNIYALMTFVLNGGNPNIFETIIKLDDIAVLPRNIVTGVLAYIHKDKDSFVSAFADKESYQCAPMDFQASINLHISNYYKHTDILKAISRLNEARLVAKGSFFEEAAIRSEIYIAAKQGDIPLVRILTWGYLEKFNKSPYMEKFWHEYISAIGLLKDKMDVDEMEKLLLHVPLPIQNFIYLTIAYQKLMNGELESAKNFSLKAIAIEDTNNYDTSKGLLYYASSLICSSKVRQAKDILKTLDVANFTSSDAILLHASKEMIENILATPKQTTPVSRNAVMVKNDKLNENATPSYQDRNITNLNIANKNVLETIDSSNKTLKAIDNMLKNDNEKYAY